MLKIDGISIKGVNGIDHLSLHFNKGFNFICGSNGVGKTTVLDCIASTFNRQVKNVRTNVKHSIGSWDISVLNNGYYNVEEFIVEDNMNFSNENNQKIGRIKKINSKEIVNFDISRTSTHKIYYRNTADFIQSWFLRNYYLENSLSEKKYNNLEIAKECFKRLDSEISFNRVVEREWSVKHSHRLNSRPIMADILVETSRGEIPLEYLSSGYKSCLIMLLGIIKQTEVTSATREVHSFQGVILIDEIDLHLHPEWQARLIDILRWLVPNAQIIATTHSPHIIQVSEPNEIIALCQTNFYDTIRREVPSTKYGYNGWSIEEILTDVMGLKNTHSDTYLQYLSDFQNALSTFDSKAAFNAYEEIDKMLHPNNHLRKILKIQMTSLEKIKYD